MIDKEESAVLLKFKEIFNADKDENVLLKWRALGPAIAKDIAEYLENRSFGSIPTIAHLAEAVLLYVVPQFEGLNPTQIKEIYDHLKLLFPDSSGAQIRERIEELFPFVDFINKSQ